MPRQGASAILQLPLPLRLRGGPTFENFIAGTNGQARYWVEQVAKGVGPEALYLWGAPGVGKTHLLEAACRAVAARGGAVGFVPLRQHAALDPLILSGLETAAVVCVDDLQALAGDSAWEEALFHLFNRTRSAGGCLLLAGQAPPAGLGLSLPDLASRVTAALTLRLVPLADSDRVQAVQRRARDLGFVVPDDVAAYLLRRFPRDLSSLFALLNRLDEGSLAARRRVTLPLARTLLEREEM
jgi:DnaA family protein